MIETIKVTEYFMIEGHQGTFSGGYVIEKMHLPYTNSKDYVLVYDDGRLDARPIYNWLSDITGEFTEAEGGPESVIKDTSLAGERQPWGMGDRWTSTNYAYYIIDGVTWRVLLDGVGWPFIIDKVED